MEQLRQGKAARVIVYKLDRISRSILDFANMMEEFQQFHVEFVSCTEKFDTSTPMGRAMLNICIVFAQLERETIQMRVTDSYAARMKHGFFMGGHIPYGFTLEPIEVDGIHTKRYVPESVEAEHIRLICSLYADMRNSIGDVVKHLQGSGIVNRRGKPWTRERILETIRNPIYVKADRSVYDFYKQVGAEVLSDQELFIGQNGCFLFTGEDGRRKECHLEGTRLILAPHQGIVEPDVWLACRKRNMGNKPLSISNKAKWTWLAGKAKCAECGYALVVKRAPPNWRRYLACSHRYNSHGCSSTGLLKAEQVEACVAEQIKAKLESFGVLCQQKPEEDPRAAELRARLSALAGEKEVLLSRILVANDAAMKLINSRVAEIERQEQAWSQELLELERSQAGVDAAAVADCAGKWDSLEFEDKRTVLNVLVEKIEISRETVHIFWRV